MNAKHSVHTYFLFNYNYSRLRCFNELLIHFYGQRVSVGSTLVRHLDGLVNQKIRYFSLSVGKINDRNKQASIEGTEKA